MYKVDDGTDGLLTVDRHLTLGLARLRSRVGRRAHVRPARLYVIETKPLGSLVLLELGALSLSRVTLFDNATEIGSFEI